MNYLKLTRKAEESVTDLTEEEFVRDAAEEKPERSKHEEDSTCDCWPRI